MFGAIKYNLTHLLDFNGRDARQTFWYYVLFVVVLQWLISMVLVIPIMVRMFQAIFEQAQAGASEEVMQAQMQLVMGGMMGDMMWATVALAVLQALLLLAAFVRRLHDSGKSGWWAALALLGQAAGIVAAVRVAELMPRMMPLGDDPAALQRMIESQQDLGPYSAASWLGALVVIGFGILKSTDGPNRYGTEPVRF